MNDTLHLGCEQGLKILGVSVDTLVERVKCTMGSADIEDVDIYVCALSVNSTTINVSILLARN